MVPKEDTYLLARPVYDFVRINVADESKLYKPRELTKEDLAYHTAHPVWIKVRLCLFWAFWTAFLVVMVLSVLIYLCLFPSACRPA